MNERTKTSEKETAAFNQCLALKKAAVFIVYQKTTRWTRGWFFVWIFYFIKIYKNKYNLQADINLPEANAFPPIAGPAGRTLHTQRLQTRFSAAIRRSPYR